MYNTRSSLPDSSLENGTSKDQIYLYHEVELQSTAGVAC